MLVLAESRLTQPMAEDYGASMQRARSDRDEERGGLNFKVQLGGNAFLGRRRNKRLQRNSVDRIM